jgi:hypothetical protein
VTKTFVDGLQIARLFAATALQLTAQQRLQSPHGRAVNLQHHGAEPSAFKQACHASHTASTLGVGQSTTLR